MQRNGGCKERSSNRSLPYPVRVASLPFPPLMLLRYFGCKIADRSLPFVRSAAAVLRPNNALLRPPFGPVLNAACGKVTMRVGEPTELREGGILIALFPSIVASMAKTHSTLSPSLLSVSPPSIFSRSHEFQKRRQSFRGPSPCRARELGWL